jgi:hypothetical protein
VGLGPLVGEAERAKAESTEAAINKNYALMEAVKVKRNFSVDSDSLMRLWYLLVGIKFLENRCQDLPYWTMGRRAEEEP